MVEKLKENEQQYGFTNNQDYIKEIKKRELYSDPELTQEEIKELNEELEKAKKHGKRMTLREIKKKYK